MPWTCTTAPLSEPRWWCLGQEHQHRSDEANRPVLLGVSAHPHISSLACCAKPSRRTRWILRGLFRVRDGCGQPGTNALAAYGAAASIVTILLWIYYAS